MPIGLDKKVEPIPLMRPLLNQEMIDAVVKSLKHERFLNGPSVVEFERSFSDFTGVPDSVAVNNGTNALWFAIVANGLRKGDIVITTPATFIATANAIGFAGGKVVFADISSKDFNIDPTAIEAQIEKFGSRVRAILPVHLYGRPADMKRILKIADEFQLKVIEDACQAHGAEYEGKRAGALGQAAAFSFYPSKNMTVGGDGGMITASTDEVAETGRMLRDVGRSSRYRYLHDMIGYTARMNTVNAAIGLVQLKYLNELNATRRRNAAYYLSHLSGVGDILLPPRDTDTIISAWHQFVIQTEKRTGLQDHLTRLGIETGVHYPVPVHLQPPYADEGGVQVQSFPNSELLSRRALSIPVHPSLKSEELEYVVQAIKEFYED